MALGRSGDRMAPVPMGVGAARADRQRSLAGLVAIASFAALLLFGLPFVSASCKTTRSEPLTGWELVRGVEPTMTSEAPLPSEAENQQDEVRDAISSVGKVSRVAVAFVGAALLGSLASVARPTAVRLARWQLGLSMGAGLAMCMIWAAGGGSDATLHHHAGLAASTIAAWVAALLQLLRFGFSVDDLPWWAVFFLGVVVVAPFAVIAVVIGGAF